MDQPVQGPIPSGFKRPKIGGSIRIDHDRRSCLRWLLGCVLFEFHGPYRLLHLVLAAVILVFCVVKCCESGVVE